MSNHKSITLALVEAQKNMTKASKQAKNPHLKSKYADLGSVMDACVPALNDAGIAVIQPSGEDETGRYVETILIHGESGERLGCKVPLIVQKNDMQGYGSAVTYARRYGLMTMAGIAPEDDDGHAASKAPPQQRQAPLSVSPEQFIKLRDMAHQAGVDNSTICGKGGCASLEQFPANKFDAAIDWLQSKIDEAKKSPASEAVGEDDIPY